MHYYKFSNKLLSTILCVLPIIGMNAKTVLKDKPDYVKLPGKVMISPEKGERGWYYRGLDRENDGVFDLLNFSDLSFKVKTEKSIPLEVECILRRALLNDRANLVDETLGTVNITTKAGEWTLVTIPREVFDFNKSQPKFLSYIDDISLAFNSPDGKKSRIEVTDIVIDRRKAFDINVPVKSKPLSNDEAKYGFEIRNTSGIDQQIALTIEKEGWEDMEVTLSECRRILKPDETINVDVAVKAKSGLPAGIHESHKISVIPADDNFKTEKIELISVVPVKSPFLVHDEAGWQEVKDKIANHEWASHLFEDYLKSAEKYTVPEVKVGTKSDQGTEGLVRAYIEGPLFQTAVAWKMTGKKEYADKVAKTLIVISDPETGYPRTNHLTLQGIPQEGGTMEGMLRAYDLIRDSGCLSHKDKEQIEATFRLFAENIIKLMIGNGEISNWSLFNLAPAAEAALLLNDLSMFNTLMYGPCGIIDHLRYGAMDDGWWYEVSLSYNLGAAGCFTQLIPAALPFGIDLRDMKIPTPATHKVGLRPFEMTNYLGMSFGKAGAIHNNYIDIKRLWDGILIYPDYRGVMFGMGDGHEESVTGRNFESAYYFFRDPRYVGIIRKAENRDLIYGVADLPEDTPDSFTESGYSDNAGIAVLRSQTSGRPVREQIQAATKYGTHGSYHGHFDKASLLSLMRYGRSFWNPETSWYGYGSYMYKWWTQPSMAHNMVTVDGKMQEPADSRRLLFHSGDMLQAVAVEINAKWSNPPYFGGYDQVEKVKAGDEPYVEVPDNRPEVSELTGFTEPVRQRRLIAVTDDYVIVADNLKAESEHTFDNLIHLRGLEPPKGIKPNGHSEVFDENPLSSGQFITNVTDYNVTEGVKLHSIMEARAGKDWNQGGFNGYQEPGPLNVDVFQAWPKEGELRIGTYPDAIQVKKQVVYSVDADGKTIESGKIYPWVLGRKYLRIPVKDVKQLKLSTTVKNRKLNSLLWVNPTVKNAKGMEVALSPSRVSYSNVITLANPAKDYKGGPIVVAGKPYSTAIGAEPEDDKQSGIVTIDLDGLDAEELTVSLGSDFPIGDDKQVRRTAAYRTKGNQASYLTVIEPYEDKPMVKKVEAKDASSLTVHLNDGRTQFVKINGLDSDTGNISVEIEEKRDNQTIRKENTSIK